MAKYRTLTAYTLHGRSLDQVADYPAFFAGLAALAPLQRQVTINDRLVAVTAIDGGSDLYRLRFVLGEVGAPPLTFDPESGEEQSEDIGRRVLINATWGFFDPVSRIAAIERRRPGVPVPIIANALSQIGRQAGYSPNLTFSLNPIADQTFLSELNRYERIREAEIEIARPNYDWSDSAEDLTTYAAESDAGTAVVSMKAQRGGSLASSNGIVADIRQLIGSKFSPLKNARITGRREDEERETTLSLARHQRKRVATIPDGADRETEAEVLTVAADNLISETAGATDEADTAE